MRLGTLGTSLPFLPSFSSCLIAFHSITISSTSGWETYPYLPHYRLALLTPLVEAND
jgi:hypothetical protein